MPLFSYDRSLPVTPAENANDVQAMLEQIRDFFQGQLSGDNFAVDAITSREVGDQVVTADILTAAAARRLGERRSGAHVRRQVHRQADQPFVGDNIYKVLATHTYTSEASRDVILFGALLGGVSDFGVYSVDIRLDGVSAVPSRSPMIDPTEPPVSLGERGWLFQDGLTGLLGPFQWHVAPFANVGDTRTLQLLTSTNAGGATRTWGLVAMYSMMIELG